MFRVRCNSQLVPFQPIEKEMRSSQQMRQQKLYLEMGIISNEKFDQVYASTEARQLIRLLGTTSMRKCFYLEPNQQRMLPKPKEGQGNKQITSEILSSKNCLKPSSE